MIIYSIIPNESTKLRWKYEGWFAYFLKIIRVRKRLSLHSIQGEAN